MRKIVLGLAPVLMAVPSGAFAAAPEWKMSEVTGDVHLTHDRRSRAATKGGLPSDRILAVVTGKGIDMRKIVLGLAPVLMAGHMGAVAAAPEGKVSEVTGDVHLSHEGRSRAATKGALLSSGAVSATGPKARAVIVRGQEFVVDSASSQLRVPAADSPNKIMQIIEDFGTALFNIEKKRDRKSTRLN